MTRTSFINNVPLYLLLVLGMTLVSTAANPKRGLAFADSQNTGDISTAVQSGTNISWIYDWGTIAPSYLTIPGFPYYPMQWGEGGVESFGSEVISQGATVALVSHVSFAHYEKVRMALKFV